MGFGADDDSSEAGSGGDPTVDTSDDGATGDSDPQGTNGNSDGGDGNADDDGGVDEGDYGGDADDEAGEDADDSGDEAGEDADDSRDEAGEDADDSRDEAGEDADDPPTSLEEDCISFDPDNLNVVRARVEEPDGRWKTVARVIEDTHQLLELESMSDAFSAKEIIEFYGFNRHCFVGRPDSVMAYWLVDGRPATLSQTPFTEDCISIDHTNLTVEQTAGGEWRLTDGTRRLMTDPDEEAIRTAKATIEHHEFSRHCFVGRPNPPMTYWLTE
ncbi:hypothetical protein AB7C87_05950 [Natrarchaeobius sp. A-rgal3]|uniref:hypothetical protein n=1 Tax=Natrarchaeobius versutus TaxID=1679078 RepID=UPI00350F98AB